jgi:hypothetical protein
VSLVHYAEMGALKRIERFVRTPLPVNVVAGFEPRKAPPKGGFGGGRGRPAGNGGGRRFGGSGGGSSSGRGYGASNASGYGNKSNAGSRDGGGYRSGNSDGGYRGGNRGEGGFGSRDGYSARRNDGPRAPRRGS